jgi:hypothetical protein
LSDVVAAVREIDDGRTAYDAGAACFDGSADVLRLRDAEAEYRRRRASLAHGLCEAPGELYPRGGYGDCRAA